MFIRHILAAGLLAAGTTAAVAGGFVAVDNTGARTPGSTNNPATDPFYLASVPTTWTVLGQRTTAVDFNVYDASRTTFLGNYVVGTFIDTVWRDPSNQDLIFGSYFRLNDTTHGITEISSLVRSGFTGFNTVSAAWTFADTVYPGAAGGYRLRDPSRSDYVATYVAANAASYYDPSKIAIRTDVSPSEGNPNTGLYLLRVPGAGYTYSFKVDAMHIVQGASSTEGGRLFQETYLDVYVPTALPVPEPQTYAMLLAGLGLVGWKLRRLKQDA